MCERESRQMRLFGSGQSPKRILSTTIKMTQVIVVVVVDFVCWS